MYFSTENLEKGGKKLPFNIPFTVVYDHQHPLAVMRKWVSSLCLPRSQFPKVRQVLQGKVIDYPQTQHLPGAPRFLCRGVLSLVTGSYHLGCQSLAFRYFRSAANSISPGPHYDVEGMRLEYAFLLLRDSWQEHANKCRSRQPCGAHHICTPPPGVVLPIMS